jgi:hypothetical protein
MSRAQASWGEWCFNGLQPFEAFLELFDLSLLSLDTLDQISEPGTKMERESRVALLHVSYRSRDKAAGRAEKRKARVGRGEWKERDRLGWNNSAEAEVAHGPTKTVGVTRRESGFPGRLHGEHDRLG